MLRVIAGCLGLLLSALPCACALADAFPNKPIRLIVGAGQFGATGTFSG